MTTRLNAFEQPIGAAVPDWTPREAPPQTAMAGRTCRLEPLDVTRHAADLYAIFKVDPPDDRDWTYLSAEPPADFESYVAQLAIKIAGHDPMPFAICDPTTGRALGLASYMRIDQANGCLEIGAIQFGPALRGRPAGTEAVYLMLARAFDTLEYRRFEWKCDTLHAGSRAAALRYGFVFEGIFRQAVVYKGRSRDTAWHAIIDKDWPTVRAAFEAWLDPGNFDDAGRQIETLAAIRSRISNGE